MQAILISSKDNELGRREAQKIFNELKIDKFDITTFEYEKAVGIQDVRELQKKIYLKPIKSEFKAVFIDATEGITTEAQNALLKTLEETPSDTIIIVQVQNADEILPTILSRCKIIELKSETERNSSHFKLITGNVLYDNQKIPNHLSKHKNDPSHFIENLI